VEQLERFVVVSMEKTTRLFFVVFDQKVIFFFLRRKTWRGGKERQ